MLVKKKKALYDVSIQLKMLGISGDLKVGSEVKITGPVGKEMLMPKDPNVTVVMVYILLPLNVFDL